MKKILGTALYGFLAVFSIVALFLVIGSVKGSPYRTILIDSSMISMEPTLHTGDYVVVIPTRQNIPAGTIISFYVDGQIITHRLIAEYKGGRPITQGDAIADPDPILGKNFEVIGVVKLRIPLIGYPLLVIYSVGDIIRQFILSLM
jgi:signal peptidase I